MPKEHGRTNRLNGAVILLACGLPEAKEMGEDTIDDHVTNMEDQIIRVEEAVISLSRAVFSTGGRLAFADDVLLTPLIAQVASEYWEPHPVEVSELQQKREINELAPVIVYKPRPELNEIEALTQQGYVHLQPERPSRLAAVVAIGGNRMQSNEYAEWESRREEIPFYLVASSGGLAGSLHEDVSASDRASDSRLWHRIESARKEITFPVQERRFSEDAEPESSRENIPEFRYSLYPVLMSNIVAEVARLLGR